jgi:hypothetical protein
MGVSVPERRCFQLYLIKPSHYDDDGYVIRWWRATIPSNSLATVYSVAADCAERQILGPGVTIAIEAIDESNTHVNVGKLIERSRRNGNFGLIGLVGVQSNQYPAGARYRPSVPSRQHLGRLGWISGVRLPVYAE